jgi:hypothetical protein
VQKELSGSANRFIAGHGDDSIGMQYPCKLGALMDNGRYGIDHFIIKQSALDHFDFYFALRLIVHPDYSVEEAVVTGALSGYSSTVISPISVVISTMVADRLQETGPASMMIKTGKTGLYQFMLLYKFIKYVSQTWFANFLKVIVNPGIGFFNIDQTIQVYWSTDDH